MFERDFKCQDLSLFSIFSGMDFSFIFQFSKIWVRRVQKNRKLNCSDLNGSSEIQLIFVWMKDKKKKKTRMKFSCHFHWLQNFFFWSFNNTYWFPRSRNSILKIVYANPCLLNLDHFKQLCTSLVQKAIKSENFQGILICVSEILFFLKSVNWKIREPVSSIFRLLETS